MRRIFMWIAVISLATFAFSSALTTLMWVYSDQNGWVLLTPYSRFHGASSSYLVDAIKSASFAQRFLLPLCTLSTAVYIVLLERDFRATEFRGFSVEKIRNDAEPKVGNQVP